MNEAWDAWVVAGQTLARAPVLLAAERHEAVYDFGGFDPKLFTLRYDAPGALFIGDVQAHSVPLGNNGLVEGGQLFFLSNAGVPEPASWAMMIAGFGIAGAAMRRKAKVSTTVSYS